MKTQRHEGRCHVCKTEGRLYGFAHDLCDSCCKEIWGDVLEKMTKQRLTRSDVDRDMWQGELYALLERALEESEADQETIKDLKSKLAGMEHALRDVESMAKTEILDLRNQLTGAQGELEGTKMALNQAFKALECLRKELEEKEEKLLDCD